MAWDRRDEYVFHAPPLAESVAHAKALGLANPGAPVLLIDHCDNCGSGGAQDVMAVVAEVLKQELDDVAIAPIRDPAAVATMIDAGVGQRVRARRSAGTPTCRRSGSPGSRSRSKAACLRSPTASSSITGPMYTGVRMYLGRTAVLDTGRAQIVVTERPHEPFDLGVFTHAGIDPRTQALRHAEVAHPLPRGLQAHRLAHRRVRRRGRDQRRPVGLSLPQADAADLPARLDVSFLPVDTAGLKRLSTLLDEGLDLDPAARERWLAALEGEDAALAPRLRDLLSRHAAQETNLISPSPWLAASAALAPGETVGPYRLLRELGSGGMGSVWLAERSDGQLKRSVALKLPHVSWTPGIAERFAREREILAALEHPHIARLYDAGADALGRPYMALEYVEGRPIDEHCRTLVSSVAERLALLLQAAEAVTFAHTRLVVHRDLKPGNILVTPQGQVRLLDFGIAKLMEGDLAHETALTRMSGRALSRNYASPEQIRGDAIGTASDVYSLGVVAFELLAGAPPYRLDNASPAALEAAIVSTDVPLASAVAREPAAKAQLRGDLDAILNKALKKEPAERYVTVDALAQDWRRHLQGERVLARHDTLAYRASRFARRYRVYLAVGAATLFVLGLALGVGATSVVIFALLLGLTAALWQARSAREQARNARREAATSNAVLGFIEGLFRTNARAQADPQAARQRTAKDLLDEGASRIDDALRDAPEAKFTLLATLAQMYTDLGEPNRAADFTSQRAALAERLHGAGSARHAEALVAWGVALVGLERHEEAKAVLTRANDALDRLEDPDPALRIDSDLALGELYRYVRDPRGLPHAERAMALLMRGEASLRWIDAQMLLGAMQGLAGRWQEAGATLDRAIGLAATLEGGEARLPMLYEAAASNAEDAGDRDRAERSLRSAIEVEARLSGENNSGTVGLMRQLGRLLTNRGRLPEALALFADARKRIDAWPPSRDRIYVTQLILMFEGRAWLGYGHPQRAIEILDQALTLMSGGENPRTFAIVQMGRCNALAELDRLQEAATALDEARAALAKFGLEGPDLMFNVAQSAIGLAILRDDAPAALACWNDYAAQVPPDVAQAWLSLLRAEIAFAMKDTETTAANAAAAIERMRRPPEPFGVHKLGMRAHQLLGLARLAQDKPADALALLSEARRWSEATQDPDYGLERASVAVDLGLALAAHGEHSRARPLLDEARAVHARHAYLGERHARPLRQLEAELARIDRSVADR